MEAKLELLLPVRNRCYLSQKIKNKKTQHTNLKHKKTSTIDKDESNTFEKIKSNWMDYLLSFWNCLYLFMALKRTYLKARKNELHPPQKKQQQKTTKNKLTNKLKTTRHQTTL